MDGEYSESPAPRWKTKASRRRVITSCTECSRRKQKCDREWPCNHCSRRRAAQNCEYTNHKLDGKPKIGSSGTLLKANEHPDQQISNGVGGEQSEGGNVNVLESLGYNPNSPINLIGEIQSLMTSSKGITDSTTSRSSAIFRNDRRRMRDAVLSLLPPKSTVDYLVQFYIREINWYSEIIYPPAFLERYSLWWTQNDYYGIDDVQFAALIMRICALAAQCLPEQLILDTLGLPEEASIRYSAVAQDFDSYQPRRPSLTRVEQLYFHLDYLRNRSEIKESWNVLAEAAKEAQDIGLHLENPSILLSDFEMEVRRRVFWCLYEWDRWMSTFLGRWPVIPDQVISISLPRDSFRLVGASHEAPTNFTDRIVQFKLVRFLSELKASATQTSDNIEDIVTKYTERFQENIVEQLPPAFRLYDPDTTFDSIIPNIGRKRGLLRLSVLGLKANIYRLYLGVNNQRSSQNVINKNSRRQQRIQNENRDNFVSAIMEALETCLELSKLLGDIAKGFPIFSIIIMEICCLLAMLQISALSDHMGGRLEENTKVISQGQLHGRVHLLFSEGYMAVEQLAPVSKVAQKCAQVLKPFHEKLTTALEDVRQINGENSTISHQALPTILQSVSESKSNATYASHIGSMQQISPEEEYTLPSEFSTFFSSSDMIRFFEENMLASFDVNQVSMQDSLFYNL